MFKRLSRVVSALERLAAAADDFVDLEYSREGYARPARPASPEESTVGLMVSTDESTATIEQRERRAYGDVRDRDAWSVPPDSL